MAGHTRTLRDRLQPCAVVGIAYLVLVWGAILMQSHEGSEAYDQDHHHAVVIDEIAASLRGDPGSRTPSELLKDYPSATSPGFHTVLAVVRVAGVDSLLGLQLVSSLCGLVLAVTVCAALGRSMPRWHALGWTMPLLLSPYFLGGSIWLTTDVAAWMLQFGALVLILGPTPSVGRLAAIGVLATLAVFVRQPSVWMVAPIAALGVIRWRSSHQAWSPGHWIAWVLAIALPLAVLAGLVAIWGGLVPPSFRAQHAAGANWATPSLFLALLGLWGSPWLVVTHVTSDRHGPWRVPVVGLGAGLLVGLLPQTDYARESGRWGGPIWSVIESFPSPMGHSVVVIALAGLGGAVLAALISRAWQHRDGRLLVLAMLSFVAAATANTQCFERYIDLPILMFLPLLVAAGDTEDPSRRQSSWPEVAAPVVLAVMQLGMSAVMVGRIVLFTAAARGAATP